MILGIKIKKLEFGNRIGYWDWGLRLRCVIGDRDRGFDLGIRNGGLGLELEIAMGIEFWDRN